MIGKLLGGKKKKGYYLELSEADKGQVSATAKEEIKEKVESVVETVKEKASEIASTESSQKTTNKKTTKKKTSKTKAAPTSEQSKVTANDSPGWVATINANTNNGNATGASLPKTFATDNLMPTPSTYRRRPGPSMKPFIDMASQRKSSNSSRI